MINIRVFSEDGIEKFKEYIQELKNNSNISRPDLNVYPYSSEFQPKIEIDESKTFTTRMEMGKYLTDCFSNANIKRNDVIENKALWTWLSYIWFDQFCPMLNGERKILETARYICSSDYTDYFRHFVANAYDIYSLYGEDLSRIFLYSHMGRVNDFAEVFACRQYIISSKGLVKLVNQLYWDLGSNQPKRGSTSRKKPGNTRRLPKVLNQIELTYDIVRMRSEEILNLIPAEFNEWK